MKTKVKVIIPIYKLTLNNWEYAALKNNIQILSSHPIVFLKPEGLDITCIVRSYPQTEVVDVSTNWLGVKRGIAGYNEMMMSKKFYDLFSDTEYILICHTDAWIFRDELLQWCEKGYDLVAAPWPTRPRYRYFPLKQFLAIKKKITTSTHEISRIDMYDKIGNGGLCLRKTSTFGMACEHYATEIAYFNSLSDSMHNEDIFWALIPKELNYPNVKEALKFAFDLKPQVCYQLNNKQLPMGCHGFMHKSRTKFWKPFIPNIE